MKKQKKSQHKKTETPPIAGRFISFLSGFYIFAAIVPCCMFFLLGDLISALIAGTLFSSFFSMIFYKTDKNLAENEHFRIPEWNLHCWDVLWGWPGGFLAQQCFRHKTKKISFQIFFWLTLIANIALSVYIIWHSSDLYNMKDFCTGYVSSALADAKKIL